ncbi:restriction endonuclease subunit S [Corynebacterium urealyticum]|uniref:restriction endonuclease subunit S n=1 Tax=Corynebacterium urealyticum TaxID=43771 RepID=UPI001CA40A0B|nr:restriction endonuclease subunit S [Corynebacterium urealyticum]
MTNPQWRNVRLGDIGQSLIGLTYSPSNVKRSGTLVLRSSNIQDGELAFDDNVYVDCAIPEKIRTRENDILICVRNGSRRLIGKSVILDRRVSGQTFGAFMAVYRSDLNPFLRYFFQSDDFKRQIDEHLGATINQITNESLNGFVVTLPSKSEQQAITERLQDVDRLIATLKRLISKKYAIKQGMMQELLTGRTRLPGFNRPWHEKLLGDLTRIKTGSRNNQDKVSSGAYPFFVRSQTVERIDTYSYSGEAVLIPGEGGIGEIFHYINGCHEVHQRVYRISDFSGISGKFAFYYLQQFFKDHALRNTVKATVDSIRLPIIQSFKMIIPGSIDEQTAIAALLDDTLSEIDTLERRLESARNIKQGMMQELLTGRTRLPVEEVSS